MTYNNTKNIWRLRKKLFLMDGPEVAPSKPFFRATGLSIIIIYINTNNNNNNSNNIECHS